MTLIRDGPMLFADEHEPQWHGKPIQQLVRSELIELIYADEKRIRAYEKYTRGIDKINKLHHEIDDMYITFLEGAWGRSKEAIDHLKEAVQVARDEAAELRIKLGELQDE